MSVLDTLKDKVTQFAPLLGTVLGGAPGAAIGQLVASAFGGDISKPDELVKRIQADPDAEAKLLEIQNKHREELERLSVQRALQLQQFENTKQAAVLTDTQNARAENNKNTKKVDEIIKVYLVISVTIIILACLWAIIEADVSQTETSILSTILGGVIGALLSMCGFYWGSSAQAR